jgi:hypothetical protein
MPAIKDPEREARRVVAVRAAILKSRAWEKGAAGVSPEGMRRRGQNPQTHGADSAAFKLAGRYAQGVLEALSLGKVGQ